MTGSEVSLPTARVLTIAGSDSGGGAGIQADLKTMLAHGVHGMSVLAGITAQNSLGVQGVWPVPLDAVAAQFHSVVDDIGVDAIKTGMLGTAEVVELVSELLRSTPGIPVVVDPVCASKHGDPLTAPSAIAAMREQLFGLATVITPNLGEARLLSDLGAEASAESLAEALLAYGPQWVLVKGGHAAGEPIDYLTDGRTARWYPAARSNNAHTHGTGCTLASALACQLALGRSVVDGMGRAKDYVTGAIEHGFSLGSGIGPVDHLWRLRDALGQQDQT